MSNPYLIGPARPPAAGGAPKQLVLLLHGWGADGANLIDLADAFATVLPHAHFISPDAPLVCEMNPYGYQWFSLMDRSQERLLEGVAAAAKILNAFIDEQLAALKLTESQLALVGFSQGTMVALHVGLRRPKPIAGIAGFSGALIGAEYAGPEIVSRPPVCLIHGQLDDVVPYAAMQQAKMVLEYNKVPVEAHTRPAIGHSIDMEGIAVATKFLGGVLAE